MDDTMKVGFIGLGVMGVPMAAHLLDGGYELFIYGRKGCPEPLRRATFCADAADVARQSDAIVLMVPDTPDVEAVLFGDDGVAKGLRAGALVIDMSSISPVATKEFAARIQALGGDYVDAPVSGGEVGAKAATLSIMAGGSAEAFARAEPLFRTMGKNITHVGPVGAGQTAKIANQIIVALNIGAVAEALAFAADAGADPAMVRKALMGGFASSRVLDVHGERMIEGNFAPGFRVELHQKDLNNALEAGRKLKSFLPATALVQQLLSRCDAKLDHSAIMHVYTDPPMV